MKGKILITLVGVAALLNSGCATIVMRTDSSGTQPKGLYPSTRADITGTVRYCRGELDLFWSDSGSSNPNLVEKMLWTAFALIDLPISLVTDSLCLPWDMARRHKKE